jgi:hypothetical protein
VAAADGAKRSSSDKSGRGWQLRQPFLLLRGAEKIGPWFRLAVAHVEKAQARQSPSFEQSLLQKLPLNLFDLHGLHAAPIR